jgi:hypothetical protein
MVLLVAGVGQLRPVQLRRDDEIDPSRHRWSVQAIRGGVGGYFASCQRCGCDPFRNRPTKGEANVDGAEHLAAKVVEYDVRTARLAIEADAE